MRFSSAAAGVTAKTKSMQTMTALMAIPSCGLHIDVLDDVAEVAGGVPEGLRALGFTDPVERANHQAVTSRARGGPGRRPLAERVAAQVGPELGATPCGSPVDRELHLADPVAAVEGDTFDRHGLPHPDARAGRR